MAPPLPANTRVRVTRVLVFEGDAAWVQNTLAHALVRGVGEALQTPRGTIHCITEEIENLD